MWAPRGTHKDSARTPHGSHLIWPRHPSESIRNPHGSHLMLLADPAVSTFLRFPKEGVNFLHFGTRKLVDTVRSPRNMRWLPCGFRMDSEGCPGRTRWLPCGLRVHTLSIPKGGRVPSRLSRGLAVPCMSVTQLGAATQLPVGVPLALGEVRGGLLGETCGGCYDRCDGWAVSSQTGFVAFGSGSASEAHATTQE